MESESRIALIGIIVYDKGSVAALNDLLHAYGDCVVGRMGVPYRDRGVSIISLIADAPEPVIAALAGKLGRLDGVTVRTMYAKSGDEA